MLGTSEGPVPSDIIQVLQLRTFNDPWLPRLETFQCEESTDGFIPLIPLFLSPKITRIWIGFAESTPAVVIGSMIARLSILCPDLERVTLNKLPEDPIITEAASELLLACNRDTLETFEVDSPLTDEAREVVSNLPTLSSLWVVIQGPTLLPTMTLPNLTRIDVEHDDDIDWLQGFRGTPLEKLESVSFCSESDDIGDFLGAFERVALSAQNTLSGFRFYTSGSWDPKYSPLLSFKRLKKVEIQFSCEDGCSSRVDDDIIVNLARSMPGLEALQLGDTPCATPIGITINGFVGLARLCPHLSKLRIRFQVTSLVEAATGVTPLPSTNSKPAVQREGCALTILEVGQIPFPARSRLVIAHILLQNFPRILNIKYCNKGWGTVAEIIK